MLKNHLLIAWRSLLKRKGFALINILGLSLGFGCSILIFLFIQYHLRFDNFHNNADRIYRVNTEEHRDFVDYEASVPPGFAGAFRTDYDFDERTAKFVDWGDGFIKRDDQRDPYKTTVGFAEPELFDIFNFPTRNGSGSDLLREPNTALITASLAKILFGETDPVNHTFVLDNAETIRITGVLHDIPKTSLFDQQVFVSYKTLERYDPFVASELWTGINSSLSCFTRLRPGQDIEEIEQAIASYVPKYRPNSKNVHRYRLQALSDIHFDSRYSGGTDARILWIFSLVGLFILLIAGINFINIATAQATTRSREVGVRKVLGGFPGQLFRQFMTETVILVGIAMLVGISFCLLALPSFNQVFGLELDPRMMLQPNFLMFLLIALVFVTLLSGSYPGVLLSRIAPVLALKSKLSQSDTGGYLTRKALVISQFVISMVLIIACLVVKKQLKYAIDSDLGYDRNGIIMLGIPAETEADQLKDLKNRFAASPAVQMVSLCFGSPGASDNSWGTSVVFNNRPEPEEFNLQVKAADAAYLDTFGLPLVAGRNFIERDTADEVLVNRTFVTKVGAVSPEEVIGKKLMVNGGLVAATIVGVTEDFHDQDFHENIAPVFVAAEPRLYNEFAVKIQLSQAEMALGHLEKIWKGQYPDYVFEYAFLDDRVAELYEAEQRFFTLLGIFTGMAIFIGCLGIYGLILFFVLQKTREIGIRKVLGGRVRDILSLVVQDFLKLIFIAGCIATPIAWFFMNRWLENFEYKTPLSWWVFVLAVGIVFCITLLTISYQAVKAAKNDPVKSLRTE